MLPAMSPGVYIAIGIGVGTAIGIAIGNALVGIGIGLLGGIGWYFAVRYFDRRRRGQS